MKKFYLKNYGCQMNVYDAQVIMDRIRRCGYLEVREEEEADLIILNTCSIRSSAEEKVYSKLGELRKIKEKKKDLLIGISGCLAQHYRKKLFKRFNFIDFIVNSSNLNSLPEIIKRLSEGEDKVAYLGDFKNCLKNISPYRKEKISVYLPVMFGCSNFCTYCVVPYLRGKSRSRSLREIIVEVKKLSLEGVKEVILLGQNVTYYGKDLDRKISLATLLHEISSIEGIKRIRFLTSHPKNVDENLIEALASLPNVCRHIHLPLQSGSDKILALMNRGYNRRDYLSLIERLRRKVEKIRITTDIMVGFPGEEEVDFNDTLSLVKEVEFDKAFTFKFSPRPNTPAYKMKGHLKEEVVSQRLKRLIELTNKISESKNKELIGKVEEVLVEGEAKKDKNKLYGRDEYFRLIIFKGEKKFLGRMVKVKIEDSNMRTLEGSILND